MLIIICLFLCLLICLGAFITSTVSCIDSFLYLLAFVLRFFSTNLLSSAYSALSFSTLFAFCRNSYLFLSKFLNFCIFSTLLDYGFLCFIFDVHRFFQDFVHFLYSWFFVFQSVKSVF